MTEGEGTGLSPTCGVAFKEWAGICRALAEGRQAVILRKGGIEEGPNGFRPEHGEFWLYPTYLHEPDQGLKPGFPAPPAPPEGVVDLETLVVVEWVRRVERLESLEALSERHAWTDATVRSRFEYRAPGLWVLGVRTYRRPEPWRLEVKPTYAGCKTWVPLGRSLPTADLVPVLSDEAAEAALKTARDALDS